jgi:hypothetical protein
MEAMGMKSYGDNSRWAVQKLKNRFGNERISPSHSSAHPPVDGSCGSDADGWMAAGWFQSGLTGPRAADSTVSE